MQELKPCPFCGSEASMFGDESTGTWNVFCNNGLCPTEPGTAICFSEQEAVEAWNTRAERTCSVVKNSRKYVLSDGTELFDDGCSICNGYIGAGENYCSQCGAKVVE